MKNIYLIKNLYIRPYHFYKREDGTLLAFSNKKEAIKYARKYFGYVLDNKGKLEGGCQIIKFKK